VTRGAIRGLLRLAGGYGSQGEAEHVGALSMIGAAVAFVGRQGAIRIYFSLEASEEGLAGGASTGTAVGGAAPRDFGRDPAVDVLASYGRHLPPR
jgi:hypothetical protein